MLEGKHLGAELGVGAGAEEHKVGDEAAVTFTVGRAYQGRGETSMNTAGLVSRSEPVQHTAAGVAGFFVLALEESACRIHKEQVLKAI